MSAPDESENPLWQFSLAVYGKPGVESHCMWLQDEQGDDVNCLLLCCWCGYEGIDLGGGLWADILALPAWQQWCKGCIGPLRAARRGLKGHPFSAAPALRRRVQALELEAERYAQDFLLDAVLQQPRPGDRAGPGLLVANMQAYRAAAGGSQFLPEELLVFLRASFPGLPERELAAAAGAPSRG